MEAPTLTLQTKQAIEAILRRAAEDMDFRRSLMEEPDVALADYDLGEQERALLSDMRRVALEEWGVDVRRFRAFLRDNGNKISVAV